MTANPQTIKRLSRKTGKSKLFRDKLSLKHLGNL